MADWNSLTVSPERNGDFMSLFTTKTSSPLYRMNGHISELQFSPSPGKQHMEGQHNTEDGKFCDNNNLDKCVLQINQEVTTMGMHSLYENNSDTHDSVKLVNCTHELLQKYQRSSRIREELENRQHRTEVDIQNLQLSQNRLKQSLEQNERNLAQQQEKERQLISKNKVLASRLKMEKEEVKKLQSAIQYRDAQYKHEQKKKERELIKLKERIHFLISDKTEKRLGLEMANPLVRADGKRGTWQTGNKHEEEMYRSVISSYEEKQKELMVENSELRQCLRDMQKELVDMLGTPDNSTTASNHDSIPENVKLDAGETTEDEDSASVSESDHLSEAHFEMPYEFVRGDIEKNFKEKVRLLRQYIKKIENQKGISNDNINLARSLEDEDVVKEDMKLTTAAEQVQQPPNTPAVVREDRQKKEIDKLNKQIDRYRDIIDQQEALLQQQLDTPHPGEDVKDSSILNASYLWDEKEKLENEKRMFLEQKHNFDEERKHFTEAAIRLGRERKEFEEHKGSILQNQFFQLTPFRESNNNTNSVLSTNDQNNSNNKACRSLTSNSESSVAEESDAPTTMIPSIAAQLKLATPVKTPSPEELSDTPSCANSMRKAARTRRQLPATPSTSNPAPSITNNITNPVTKTTTGGDNNEQQPIHHHHPQHHHHFKPITTPRVMARPHSSIAISDGSAPDSVPSATSFAPRALRPRSNAPSTAELYKKLGLEPPNSPMDDYIYASPPSPVSSWIRTLSVMTGRASSRCQSVATHIPPKLCMQSSTVGPEQHSNTLPPIGHPNHTGKRSISASLKDHGRNEKLKAPRLREVIYDSPVPNRSRSSSRDANQDSSNRDTHHDSTASRDTRRNSTNRDPAIPNPTNHDKHNDSIFRDTPHDSAEEERDNDEQNSKRLQENTERLKNDRPHDRSYDSIRSYDDRHNEKSHDTESSTGSSRDLRHNNHYDKDKENRRERKEGGGRGERDRTSSVSLVRSNSRNSDMGRPKSGISRDSYNNDVRRSSDTTVTRGDRSDSSFRDRSTNTEQDTNVSKSDRSRRERSRDTSDRDRPSKDDQYHHQRESSRDRKKDKDRDVGDKKPERQYQRPRTAREFREHSSERPSSRGQRERPRTARDRHMDERIDNSRRKSYSTKELDRQWDDYNRPRREGSFDYSEYSRDKNKYDRENSRERSRGSRGDNTRYSLSNGSSRNDNHESNGNNDYPPWRRASSNNYSSAPLLLRNPERTDGKGGSSANDRRKHSLSRRDSEVK